MITLHETLITGFGTEPTIRFSFEKLVVLGHETESLPLSQLDDESHIHGGLRIRVGDRIVPHMGFWNEDDVCFGDWIQEFDAVLKTFEGSDNVECVFDEGEQGQPAYLFERQGDTVFLSIVESYISGGAVDPEWQRVSFQFADLREQYSDFRVSFESELRRAAPMAADKWLKQLRVA